jgi:hypothetical protein
MADVPPAAADLIARFPPFAAVPTATIASALAEAATRVDDTWTAGDYVLGVLLYAAHVLTLDGQGTSAEAALGAAGALGFSSLRAGSLALERGAVSGSDAGGVLAATTYGRRFLALLRVNQPSILVP